MVKYKKVRSEVTSLQYIKQVFIILAFTAMGELLAHLIPLPIPAAIYGLLLLLTALCTGLLKPEKIAETAHFLVNILSLLLIAPTVNFLSYWGIIAPNLVPICIIVVVSTFVVFTVSGLVTKALLQKKGGTKNG